MVSATSFTLVGVVNKFLTVLLNVVVWDKHSTPTGIFAVCLCLLAGVFYQQAPRRDDAKSDAEKGNTGGSVRGTRSPGSSSVELTPSAEGDRAPLLGEKDAR